MSLHKHRCPLVLVGCRGIMWICNSHFFCCSGKKIMRQYLMNLTKKSACDQNDSLVFSWPLFCFTVLKIWIEMQMWKWLSHKKQWIIERCLFSHLQCIFMVCFKVKTSFQIDKLIFVYSQFFVCFCSYELNWIHLWRILEI